MGGLAELISIKPVLVLFVIGFLASLFQNLANRADLEDAEELNESDVKIKVMKRNVENHNILTHIIVGLICAGIAAVIQVIMNW